MSSNKVRLGDLIEVLTDYHANGAYKKLKENVELLNDEDYALMVRTTNFENNDFNDSVKYINEHAYNFLEKSKVYPNDLIMNKIANAGSIYLMPDLQRPVSLAMNLFLIRINEKLANPVYVYLYLKINEQYVKQFANGSVTKTITKEAVRNLEIFIPSRAEQDAIVQQYIALDNKIKLNLKINQTLESIAQALFKSWFIDFDPVHAKISAKLEGEDPELAAMCFISGKSEVELQQMSFDDFAALQATAALFPDEFVDSELGEVPKGWEIGELKDLIDFNPKRTLKKDSLALYLDMKNVPTQGHLVDEVIWRNMSSGTKFINGDTLLARITPCLENGKTAYVDFLSNNEVGWGSTEFIVLHPRDPLPASLGYFLARQDNFRALAIQSMTGTSGRQRANADNLANQLWVIYPKRLLIEFDKYSGKYLKQAKINGEQNRVLKSLRDTLLPKLLSGELDATLLKE